MADPLEALDGAVFDGLVAISEAPPRGMIALRGDFGTPRVKSAITAATGTEFPAIGRASGDASHGLAWMAPDELLMFCAPRVVAERLEQIGEMLAETHHLAADVSDMRVVFVLEGAALSPVLAKLTPADMARDVFVPGTFRRTRLAQVPAALWCTAPARAEVFCFRSVAGYVFDLLCNAAKPGTDPGL